MTSGIWISEAFIFQNLLSKSVHTYHYHRPQREYWFYTKENNFVPNVNIRAKRKLHHWITEMSSLFGWALVQSVQSDVMHLVKEWPVCPIVPSDTAARGLKMSEVM